MASFLRFSSWSRSRWQSLRSKWRRSSPVSSVKEKSEATEAAEVEPPGAAVDQSYHDEAIGGVDALQTQQRYGTERAKRLHPEGIQQYVDLSTSEKFKHYAEDPWLDPARPHSDAAQRFGGLQCKVLVLGAGFGGLVHAVRLIQAGLRASDIRLVDVAGGFGGTWYWNRYPGLMCDVESSIYMPLLEEMEYMPKHRYAYGNELREYADRIAAKWDLQDKAIFQTLVKEATWDDSSKRWVVRLQESRKGEEPVNFEVNSQFLISTSGLLNYPKIPKLPGIHEFQGQSFHTSRWDYNYTGGSPTNSALVNLKDKNVAIIGTGATAVQAVPQLAQWAKHLYVFQRTPSAIHEKGQQPTDLKKWAEITKEKGWQRKRSANFNAHVSGYADENDVDLVADGWTKLISYVALIGSPKAETNPQELPAYIAKLHADDAAIQDRARLRVDQTVQDKATAEKLKPWYPTWCKRPCFHDEYLATFNRPNVTLVDTDGHGVDGLTTDGILSGGKEYKIDVLIFSTGYRSPFLGNVADRANMVIKGRNDMTLNEQWTDGVSTLHGVVTHNFPDFFFPGPFQSALTANQTFTLDQLAQHTAHIITQAIKNAESDHVIIEPSAEAEQAWTMEILMRAAAFAGMANCTPSYFNREGEMDREMTQAEQMKLAKSSAWGLGIEDYLRVLGEWRAKGDLAGLEVNRNERND